MCRHHHKEAQRRYVSIKVQTDDGNSEDWHEATQHDKQHAFVKFFGMKIALHQDNETPEERKARKLRDENQKRMLASAKATAKMEMKLRKQLDKSALKHEELELQHEKMEYKKQKHEEKVERKKQHHEEVLARQAKLDAEKAARKKETQQKLDNYRAEKTAARLRRHEEHMGRSKQAERKEAARRKEVEEQLRKQRQQAEMDRAAHLLNAKGESAATKLATKMREQQELRQRRKQEEEELKRRQQFEEEQIRMKLLYEDSEKQQKNEEEESEAEMMKEFTIQLMENIDDDFFDIFDDMEAGPSSPQDAEQNSDIKLQMEEDFGGFTEESKLVTGSSHSAGIAASSSVEESEESETTITTTTTKKITSTTATTASDYFVNYQKGPSGDYEQIQRLPHEV